MIDIQEKERVRFGKRKAYTEAGESSCGYRVSGREPDSRIVCARRPPRPVIDRDLVNAIRALDPFPHDELLIRF